MILYAFIDLCGINHKTRELEDDKWFNFYFQTDLSCCHTRRTDQTDVKVEQACGGILGNYK